MTTRPTIALRAVQVLREFLRLRPTHALAHYELGKVYEMQGRAADAGAEYEVGQVIAHTSDPFVYHTSGPRARPV